MEKQALSVVPEVFKARREGEKDSQMWRVYVAADDGRIGYLYSTKEVKTGDVIRLGLKERDGRLKLAIIHKAAR